MALEFSYKVTPQLSNKALEAIEIAKNSGKLKKGSNEATKVVERNQAKLVVIAEDVNPIEVVMHLIPLCEEKQIPCIPVKSKQELGEAAGLQVPSSAIAIVEPGEAKSIVEEIAKEIKAKK
jgi:large subunit ribosomal protein L7Ae